MAVSQHDTLWKLRRICHVLSGHRNSQKTKAVGGWSCGAKIPSANLSLSLLEAIHYRCPFVGMPIYKWPISFSDTSKLQAEQRHNQCCSSGRCTMAFQIIPPYTTTWPPKTPITIRNHLCPRVRKWGREKVPSEKGFSVITCRRQKDEKYNSLGLGALARITYGEPNQGTLCIQNTCRSI